MPHKKVPLSAIKTITLRNGYQTKARRVSAVPQLKCSGKYCTYAPDIVQCTNTGDDGTGAQWRCEADLPADVKFGEVEVSCEGWSKAGDTDVLAGSCGLEYELVRDSHGAHSWTSEVKGTNIPWGLLFFVLIVAGFFYLSRRTPRDAQTPRRTGGNGGGGGGGGGGGPGFFPGSWGGPPPPYTKSEPSSSGSSGAGFWTGLAAGAAGTAAYNRFAGSNRDTTRLENELERERARAREPTRARYETPRWDDEPGPSRRATGFGGTSTR